jgi:hypothetical protein
MRIVNEIRHLHGDDFGRDYPGAGATVAPGAVFAFLAGPNTRVKALLPRTRARLGSGTKFGAVGRRPGHPDGVCWGKRKSAGAAAAGACIRDLRETLVFAPGNRAVDPALQVLASV